MLFSLLSSFCAAQIIGQVVSAQPGSVIEQQLTAQVQALQAQFDAFNLQVQSGLANGINTGIGGINTGIGAINTGVFGGIGGINTGIGGINTGIGGIATVTLQTLDQNLANQIAQLLAANQLQLQVQVNGQFVQAVATVNGQVINLPNTGVIGQVPIGQVPVGVPVGVAEVPAQ
ncbi:hypothetical protein EDD86DRAFT_64797 [Gorgonomyces haynaldii]|nr:hypothetical protein EDD86DRAFT_64797 [Gorgonomyces haynaldii]